MVLCCFAICCAQKKEKDEHGNWVCARWKHKQRQGKYKLKVAPSALPVVDCNDPTNKVCDMVLLS